jgi:hypothetical protein
MYCPNCSEYCIKSEGFCLKCGWRFGSGRGEHTNGKETAPNRIRKLKAMDDFRFYHWDFMHTDQRQFPVGRW